MSSQTLENDIRNNADKGTNDILNDHHAVVERSKPALINWVAAIFSATGYVSISAIPVHLLQSPLWF